MPEWRNGIRIRLKIVRPQGLVGSSPTSGTERRSLTMTRIYYPGLCSVCKKEKKRVHQNQRSKELICHSCRSLKYYYQNRRREICSYCHQKKCIVGGRKLEQKACGACYQKFCRQGLCAVCNRQRTIVKRLPNKKGICSACYHVVSLQARCAICQMVRPIKLRKKNGVVCANCYKAKRHLQPQALN